MLVGDYVGAQVYAAEAILKSSESQPTLALRALLRAHESDASESFMEIDSVLQGITQEQVEAALCLSLTQEQKQHLRSLSQTPYTSAVAGSGKTTVAVGIVLSATVAMRAAERAGGSARSKCVWLTPTRAQRDDALQSLRSSLRDPLLVTAVGRPSQAAALEREDGQFDEVVEAELERRLAPYMQKLKELAATCEGTGVDEDAARKAREAYVAVELEIERKK